MITFHYVGFSSGSGCARYSSGGSNIFHGHNARRNDAPYQARIFTNASSDSCGGTLITMNVSFSL